MGKLIYADLLLENAMKYNIGRKSFEEMIKCVKEQPTAYDLEAVVKQLEEMKPDIEYCDDEEDYQYNLKRHNEYIEIVRMGGVK